LDESDVTSEEDKDKLWRRNNATMMMEDLSPFLFHPLSLNQILSSPPILNSGTQYTTMMSAKDNFMKTIVRDRCWTDRYVLCEEKQEKLVERTS